MRQRSSAANLYLVNSVAIYPGSFDPLTLGHQSVIERGAEVFSTLHVVIVHNPNKTPLFSIAERVEMVKFATKHLANVEVSALESGLLVDHAKSLRAKVILKGFRTAGDIEYELPMAQVNRDLANLETVFMAAEPSHGYVSSSLVKEVAGLGGDVSGYLTPEVAKRLIERLSK
jgi:pantetheine-phosphate adenylyltransferase